MIRMIAFELVVGFLIAVVPMLYAYSLDSTEALKSMMSTLLLTNGFLVNYLLALFVAFLAVAGLSRLIWKRSDFSRKQWAFWTMVLMEAGTSIIGILRATTGVLLAFPIMWVLSDPQSVDIREAAKLSGMGLIGLIECIVLRKWTMESQLKNRIGV